MWTPQAASTGQMKPLLTSARCRFVSYARCSASENLSSLACQAWLIGMDIAACAPGRLCASGIKAGNYFRKGIVMKLTQRYLIPALVTVPAVLGLVVAPPATADCTSSGYATVCAQGDVRGGDGVAYAHTR